MAATRIVRDLLEAEIVEEIARDTDRRRTTKKRLGRPRIGLRIKSEELLAGGITVSA